MDTGPDGGHGAGFETTLALLREGLAQRPHDIFAEIDGVPISYTALEEKSARLATALCDAGVVPAARVALLLDNSADFVIALFAISRMGAIAVPLNTGLVGSFLEAQLIDSGACCLIAESTYLEREQKRLRQLETLQFLVTRAADQPTEGTRDFDDLITSTLPRPEIDVEPHGRDIAAIMYTSGTTGASKGCMLPHNYLCNMGHHMSRTVRLGANDVYWCTGPLFHLAALAIVLACMQQGAKAAVARKFSASNFWPDIERVKADIVQVIGSMIPLVAQADECEAERRYFGKLRAVIGAPFTPYLQDLWKTRFGVSHVGAPGFGMTEASMMTQQNVFDPSPPGSAGRRFTDFEARVIDEDGRELPPGEIGELVVRPTRPSIMFSGYWGRPEATLETFRDLWFHTGDLGYFDENDFFFFKDRKKDALRRRGENISSVEVEKELMRHPDVLEVVIVGIPSPLGEDDVKACVVTKPASDLTETALHEWSQRHMPRFAWPRYIEFLATLPKNAVGRALKFELRKRHDPANCWDSEAKE